MTCRWCRWEGDDLLLRLRVQPRAERDEFIEPLADALKVRITAPPVEGKANAHLVRFLAKVFGVSRGAVRLVHGGKSRIKEFRVSAPTRYPQLTGTGPGEDAETCFPSKK